MTKKQYYVGVPYEILNSPLFKNMNEKFIYAIIIGWERSGQICTTSQRTFCRWLGCSRTTVISILKGMKERGLISIQGRGHQTENGFTCAYISKIKLEDLGTSTPEYDAQLLDVFGDDNNLLG